MQLIVVAGGKTDAKTLTVTSALSCACAVSSGANPSGCNEEVATQPWLSSPAIIENYGTLNVSFKDSWNLAAVHLIIVPNGQLSNLRVGSGPDNGFILKGNLTNPTIVSGSGRDSFLRFIEDKRGDCRLNGLDPCTIPLAFAFDGSGTITVKEIWIPLS